MIQFHGMKVYYVVYQYQSGLEYIDGPFGTFWEAQAKRDNLIGTNINDEQLVVVTEHKEVTIT
jgi:hypothetical protein